MFIQNVLWVCHRVLWGGVSFVGTGRRYDKVWVGLIHMCHMTNSYVLYDLFMCVTRLMHMCHLTHSFVCRDSFICVMLFIHMCDMTHSYTWHDVLFWLLTSSEETTGWRRLRGCLKLQVIFCKRATNYRALLRKVTHKDKPSYASSPPCKLHMGFSISRLLKIKGLFFKRAL